MALEYATLMGVVVAALVAMLIYVKRGVAGRLREAADSIGSPYSPGHTTTVGPVVLASVSENETQSLMIRGQPIGVDRDQDGREDVEDVVVTTVRMREQPIQLPDGTVGATGDTTMREGTERLSPLSEEALWD